MLALAEVYDGGSRTDASRIGGVGLQIIRDWVLRFNARGMFGRAGRWEVHCIFGRTLKLNADHRRALAEGTAPRALAGARTWRGFGLDVHSHLARRENGRARVEGARRTDLRQDLGAAAPLRAKRAGRRGRLLKKTSPPNWRRSGRVVPRQRRRRDRACGGKMKPASAGEE